MSNFSDKFKGKTEAPAQGGFASKISGDKKPVVESTGGFASKTSKVDVQPYQDTTKKRDTGPEAEKFREIAKKSDGDRVFLVTGDNQNKKAWYYVLVEKTKLPLFKHKVQTDFIDLSQYGEIIECGWGEEPPTEIADRIKKDYY